MAITGSKKPYDTSPPPNKYTIHPHKHSLGVPDCFQAVVKENAIGPKVVAVVPRRSDFCTSSPTFKLCSSLKLFAKGELLKGCTIERFTAEI